MFDVQKCIECVYKRYHYQLLTYGALFFMVDLYFCIFAFVYYTELCSLISNISIVCLILS